MAKKEANGSAKSSGEQAAPAAAVTDIAPPRATYGRLSSSNKYTKDYIQLYKTQRFFGDLSAAFPSLADNGSATI